MPVIGLLPSQLDIQVYVGDIFIADIEFVDEDDVTPLPVTGYSWIAQVRTIETQTGPPTATFDVDDSEAASGVITIMLTPAQTTALLPVVVGGRREAGFTWDLQRTSDTDPDDVRTTHAGSLTAYLDRTR